MILRPEKPGGIIVQSGDIDNRLKTLFDALCLPPQTNQIPKDEGLSINESPMYCLLEDDSLITSIKVNKINLSP